jgi:hypothetical protein
MALAAGRAPGAAARADVYSARHVHQAARPPNRPQQHALSPALDTADVVLPAAGSTPATLVTAPAPGAVAAAAAAPGTATCPVLVATGVSGCLLLPPALPPAPAAAVAPAAARSSSSASSASASAAAAALVLAARPDAALPRLAAPPGMTEPCSQPRSKEVRKAVSHLQLAQASTAHSPTTHHGRALAAGLG